MSLLQPLGLLGLLGIPIIILIYLLKSKYVQKPVSSTFIWKRSLKYVKTRLPINFIFSLLLILQLLTVIFASLAISRPTILPFKAKDTVIILDSSASMMTVNSDGKTRYQLAIEEIEKTADKAGENNKITVISAGNTPETQVFRSADKVEIINAIEDLICDDGQGDVEGALVLASNVQNMNPDTSVMFYTDKEYFDADGVEIVNFASEDDENIGITNFTDTLMGAKYVFNATVNFFTPNPLNEDGTEVTREVKVSFHLDGMLVSTQTVTLKAGKNIITFASKESVAADTAIYYQISSISEYESVKVTLDGLENDGLASDDSRTLYSAQADRVKILVVSTYAEMIKNPEGGQEEASASKTTFLITVLRNIGYTLSNKTDIKKELSQVNNGGAIEGYDLYIFDGVMPQVLPDDGAVWFINPSKDPVGTSLEIGNKESAEVGSPFYMIPAVSSDSDAYKTLTKNIGKRSIAVGEYRPLYTSDSKKYEEIFTCNNQAVMMAGKENNVRVICLSLDIHMTNLPMLIDFPLMVNNMLTYSLPDVVEQRSFNVGQTVKFSAPVGATEVELRYHDENGEINVLDVMEANDTEFLLENIGIYSLLVKYDGENEKIFYLPTSVPAEESDTTAMGDTIVAEEVLTTIEVQKDPMEAWPYVAMILLAVIVIEWGVYYRDEF